jgi:hypothetical protein
MQVGVHARGRFDLATAGFRIESAMLGMLARATSSTYGTTSGREACCRLSIEQGEIASTSVDLAFRPY